MRIIKDEIIRNKFTPGFERDIDLIDRITIHGTGGGGTLNWMRTATGARALRYKAGYGLFHYLIERDGKIYEIIDPDNLVYHSSTQWRDKHTIGIELLNPDPENRAPYTEAQYDSLLWLIYDELMPRYTIAYIESHQYRKKKHKNCPGEKFDWSRIRGEIDNRGLFVEVHDVKKKVLSPT